MLHVISYKDISSLGGVVMRLFLHHALCHRVFFPTSHRFCQGACSIWSPPSSIAHQTPQWASRGAFCAHPTNPRFAGFGMQHLLLSKSFQIKSRTCHQSLSLGHVSCSAFLAALKIGDALDTSFDMRPRLSCTSMSCQWHDLLKMQHGAYVSSQDAASCRGSKAQVKAFLALSIHHIHAHMQWIDPCHVLDVVFCPCSCFMLYTLLVIAIAEACFLLLIFLLLHSRTNWNHCPPPFVAEGSGLLKFVWRAWTKSEMPPNVALRFINHPRIMTVFFPAQIYRGPHNNVFFVWRGSCSGICFIVIVYFSPLSFLGFQA